MAASDTINRICRQIRNFEFTRRLYRKACPSVLILNIRGFI
jgi:hypothetical protein